MKVGDKDMASTIANLNVKIGADLSSFEKSMGKVQKSLSGMGSKMKSAGSSLTKFATGGIAAAGAGLGVLIQKTAAHGDEVAKNARKVGVTTEAYQEYSYALGQAGLGQADVDKALGRLNQRMGMAVAGNDKYADALMALGIHMEDVKNGTISTDEAMMQAVDSLSKIDNVQQRAALATELFGTKLARELMPAIEGGSQALEDGRKKARDLGIVMSDEAAAKTEVFNDKMEDMKSKFSGVFQQLGSKLIPIIVDELIPAIESNLIPIVEKIGQGIVNLTQWFTNLSPPIKKAILIITGVVAAVGPLLTALGVVIGFIPQIIAGVKALGVALNFLAMNPVGAVIAAIGLLIMIGWKVYKNWDKIKPILISIWEAIGSAISGVINGIISGINFMIRALNKISVKVPDWVPKYGGNSFGFNLKEVSYIGQDQTSNRGSLGSTQNQNVNITVNNPQGEPTEQSIASEMKKLQYLSSSQVQTG